MLALELSSCGQIGLLIVGLCEEKGLIQPGQSGVKGDGNSPGYAVPWEARLCDVFCTVHYRDATIHGALQEVDTH